MVSQDLLRRIPPEIRLQIFELLLAAPPPIIIVYDNGEAFLEGEIPKESKHATKEAWGGRSSPIIFTCRLYYHEAFPVLLSKNQFTYTSPRRPLDDEGCIISRYFVPKRYLHHIKSLTIISMERLDEMDDAQSLVEAMFFLNLLLKQQTRLDQLLLCLYATEKRNVLIEPWACHGASFFVPLVIKYFVSNLVQRLYIGRHTRFMPPEDIYNYEGDVWKLEQHIYDLFEGEEKRIGNGGLFAVFSSWEEWFTQPYTKELEWHLVKATNGPNLSSKDVLYALGDKHLKKSGLWYGNAMLVAGEDCAPWMDFHSVDLRFYRVELRSWQNKYRGSIPVQVDEDEFEVDVFLRDLNDLKDVQEWWALWWAANKPGQRKIRDYFHVA